MVNGKVAHAALIEVFYVAIRVTVCLQNTFYFILVIGEAKIFLC
jgi:hypothetical protein